MRMNKGIPVNLTILALAAALWQAEVNGQTHWPEVGKSRIRSARLRRAATRSPVAELRQGRVHRLTRMRQRALVYEPYIVAAARKYGVDPRALWTIAYLETRFRPELVSRTGARGLMQFMASTAQRFNLTDPHDGPKAIDAAARYVLQLTKEFDGRLDLVLAGYNSGEGAVDCYRSGRTVRSSKGKVINPRGIKTGGIPPYVETIKYVKRGLLVFARVTSAGVFSPELVSQTQVLTAPPTPIPVLDQRVIDSELAELGGTPATILYSGMHGSVDTRFPQPVLASAKSGQSPPSRQAIRATDPEKGKRDGFQTVFFDVHSGIRYLVREGEIVKPLEVSAEESPAFADGRVQVAAAAAPHLVAKSFFLGTPGE